MNKFEQLIEFVINDETDKARALFHDIVVEKSRTIYENIMAEEADEELDEAKDEEELDESADEEDEEELEEGFGGHDQMGGDGSDDLVHDLEVEEEGMTEEEEGEDADTAFGGDDEMSHDGGEGEPATKGDILDLEDKLDALIAEFEDLVSGDDMGGDDMGDDMGGDDMGDEEGEEFGNEEQTFQEGLSLKAAPKAVTSEEGNVNKKSTVAANSGAKGMAASPVKTGSDADGKHDSSAYKNATKEIGIPSTQAAGKGAFKSSAPKATTSEPAGVNKKSTI